MPAEDTQSPGDPVKPDDVPTVDDLADLLCVLRHPGHRFTGR